MKNYKLTSSLLVSLLLLSHQGAAELVDRKACLSPTSCKEEAKPARASIRHIESGGIGFNQGYTTLDFFLTPHSSSNLTPFLDLRGHVFNNGKLSFNGGLGARYLGENRIYGAGVYYDYRQASLLKTANQIGCSLESLGTRWDFRLNGYFPVGTTISKANASGNADFVTFSGHSMIVKTKRQFAMIGGSGEIGVHLGRVKDLYFYTAAGPYYFNGHGENAWGGKGRISGSYKNYVKLEFSDSYDTVFRNHFQGELTFSIPFGPKEKPNRSSANTPVCSDLTTLRSLMSQPVVRQEIIVEKEKDFSYTAIDPLTGLPYYFIFVDNTSQSLGTFESPYHELATAIANSSPYNVIYLLPGDGTTTGLSAGNYSLQDYQQVLGASVTQQISTPLGSVAIPTFATQMPHLTYAGAAGIFNVASHNTISGLNLTVTSGGTSDDPVYAIGKRNGTVDSLTVINNQFDINGGSAVGIYVQPDGADTHVNSASIQGTLTVSNNRITSTDGTGSLGATFYSTNSTLISTFESNTITGPFETRITADTDGPSGIAVLTDGTGLTSILSNNNQISSLTSGITLQSVGNSQQIVTVTNTNCSGNAYGLNCSLQDYGQGFYTVLSNTFDSNSKIGAYFHSPDSLDQPNTQMNVTFASNSASGNGSSSTVTSYTYGGLVVMSGATVSLNASNNQCNDNRNTSGRACSGIDVRGYKNGRFNVQLTGNTANNNSNNGFSTPFSGFTSFAVTMEQNTANGNTIYGILTSSDLDTSIASINSQLTFVGNTTNQNGSYGLSYAEQTGILPPSSSRITIVLTDNSSDSNDTAFNIVSTYIPLTITATGNRGTNSGVYGFEVQFPFSLGSIELNNYATISSNTFTGNLVGSWIVANNFDLLGTTTVTLTDNIMTGNGSYGLATDLYGNFTATIEGNIFDHNDTGFALPSAAAGLETTTCIDFRNNTATSCTTTPYLFDQTQTAGPYNITPTSLGSSNSPAIDSDPSYIQGTVTYNPTCP